MQTLILFFLVCYLVSQIQVQKLVNTLVIAGVKLFVASMFGII